MKKRLERSVVNSKRHYKMYKSGKLWVTMAIVSTGLILSVASAEVSQANALTSNPSASSTSQVQGKAGNLAKTAATDAATQAKPLNEDSLTKGDVSGAWAQGINGKGMVVADIDTGIQTHKDFRLSDTQNVKISEKTAKSFIAKKGYGKYISPKIPFAYDYVNNDNDSTEPTEQTSFHGQHTAGIMAANGQSDPKNTQSKYVSGVAPEAQILSMKVYGGFPDESADNISRAIHDAVDLGANVINMSLGIGVAKQSLTDEEQAAVKYATDHGVFVSISASNDGAAGSIFGSSEPGGIDTAYQPVNEGTIANPGASESAATVAAENTLLGTDDDMASFSSWGPTPDYTLKPDITAPGVAIQSTWENNGYQSDDGTSMAAPFITGAAALVMQNLAKTNSNLTGAALTQTTKLAIMNSAQPMKDKNYPDALVSPRRQGAGKVDVSKAVNLNASASNAANGEGSVSLKQIGRTANFSIQIANRGTKQQTYTIDDNGGPLTQTSDEKNSNTIHDVKIDGATLKPSTDKVTVDPGKTQKVSFTLNLGTKMASNSVAEGFITFKDSDASQNLTVPYLGFSGDLTKEKVVDNPANQSNSIFGGGYLYDNNNNPLGIADSASLSNLVNTSNGSITWDNVAKKIDNSKVAFSPNNDKSSDTVSPYVFTKQNLANVTTQILDQSGKVIKTVDQENDTDKSYYQDGNSWNQDLTLSPTMRLDPSKFKWDGTHYDQSTGKEKVVPDGQYTYRIVTTNYNDGSQKQQNFDLPVKVDDAAPTIDNTNYQNGTLTVKYNDKGAGFTTNSDAVVKIGNAEQGVNLKNDGKNNNGTLTYTLTADQQKALTAGDGHIKLILTDVAGNKTTKDITAVKGSGKKSNVTTEKAPQFKWNYIGDKNNSINGRIRTGILGSQNFWELVTSDDTLTLTAKVPSGSLGLKAYALDEVSQKTYAGKVDMDTGTVTFTIPFNKQRYVELEGYATTPTDKFGTMLQSSPDGLIAFNEKTYPAMSKLTKKQDNNLVDEKTAEGQAKTIGGAPVLPGHKVSNLTTRFDPTAGIKFNGLNDNNITIVGAGNKIYNSQTKQLTISGKVDDPKDHLVILKSPNEKDAANKVTINKDGTFSYQVPFNPTGQRGIGYILTSKGKDGQYNVENRGTLEVITDTAFPTLTLPQADSLKLNPQTGEYDITTTNSTFTVSGKADDNVSGYRLYANSDNVFHEKNDAGFNTHDASQKSPNPYPAHDFNQTYNLSMGDNYFKISAVDQAGNTTTKIFHVVRQAVPYVQPYTDGGSTSDKTNSGSTSTSQPTTPSSTPSTNESTSKHKSHKLPKYAAKKKSTIYATHKLNMYSSTNFSAKTRKITYAKKSLLERPAFKVLGYAWSSNDTLRYRVRDINRHTKNYGKIGYITASPKFTQSAYFQIMPTKIRVINNKGVNGYKTKHLTKKSTHYRYGKVLHVKELIHVGSTTRFKLTNHQYVTANRKFVIAESYR